MEEKIQDLLNCCLNTLDFDNTKLSDEYYYNSLPFAIIDAVFSIGVRYTSTRSTVIRYCDYFGLKRIRELEEYPDEFCQHTMTEFINNFESVDNFTETVLKNKQRTSSRNGILKSEAVYKWAKIFQKYNVETLQTFNQKYSLELEEELKNIKGQSSGISIVYLKMLCGDNNFCKPDRHIINFITNCTNAPCSQQEASVYLDAVCKLLRNKYSNLNVRLLDHTIWRYMSNK